MSFISRKRITICLTLTLLILIIINSITHVNAQVNYGEVQNKIIEAYNGLLYAESKGANVTQLANMLNQAVQLLDKGNYYENKNSSLALNYYAQAYSIAENVLSQIPNATNQGIISQRNSLILFTIQIISLMIIGFLLYKFLPVIYWEIWYRIHKNWKIIRLKKGNRNKNEESYKLDEQIVIFSIIVVIIIGAFIVSNYFFANTVKSPYSMLGILGPDKKVGDYPKNITLEQNFTLYIFLGNKEGKVMYYRVLVKVGNATSVVNQTNYLNVQPIAVYSFILANGQNETRKINLSINTTGQNLKLVFELWAYSTSANQFVYWHIWDQLFINVTS